MMGVSGRSCFPWSTTSKPGTLSSNCVVRPRKRDMIRGEGSCSHGRSGSCCSLRAWQDAEIKQGATFTAFVDADTFLAPVN